MQGRRSRRRTRLYLLALAGRKNDLEIFRDLPRPMLIVASPKGTVRHEITAPTLSIASADFPFACVANLAQFTYPTISFSDITKAGLEELSVVGRRLVINANLKLNDSLAESWLPRRIMRHRSCTECKYRFFPLSHPWYCSDLLVQYAPGSRIIIDAALLSPARIVSDTSGPWDVAILPGMRLGPTDGVQVTNSLSGYEVCLTGAPIMLPSNIKMRERIEERCGFCLFF